MRSQICNPTLRPCRMDQVRKALQAVCTCCRTVVLTVAALAIVPSEAPAGDRLYALYRNQPLGQIELREYEPATGLLLDTKVYSDSSPFSNEWGFTWGGERFLTLSGAGVVGSGLTEIHPALGFGSIEHWLSFHSFDPHIESNPQTGEIWCLNQEIGSQSRLYRIDGATGTVTPGPFIWGASTVLNSFCIDAAGQSVATRDLALYQLDLGTGHTTALGTLSCPSGSIFFPDMAWGNGGEIVGLLITLPPYVHGGLYRIDATTLVTTPVVLMPVVSVPALGVSFAPDRTGTTYCQAKLNSLSCTPSIRGHGFPSVSAATGYEILCDNVRNQTRGVLLYSFSGPASLPFQGGTLCVGGAYERTAALDSGGAPLPQANCSGVWEVDFNTHLRERFAPTSEPLTPLTALPPGTTIHAQWFGRDPGLAAPNNTSLSNGLQLTLMP